MTPPMIALLILCIGVVTFSLRLSFILLLGKIKLPILLEKALRFVPVAVLPAIIVPAILLQNDTLNISLGNERLLAASIAIVVAWRTQNVLATIMLGMISLWVIQAIASQL